MSMKMGWSAGITMAVVLAGGAAGREPSPPAQPLSGPGGRSSAHARVAAFRLGSGAQEVFLFEPADPAPARAPVVVFGHGWGATDPRIYGAWITHIVKRGFIVIFPRYQADLRTPVSDFTLNALAGTRRALDEMRLPGHVAADPRGLAFVGHSMGGLVVANLAARAARGELPPPLALMSVEPGKTWPATSPIAFHLEELSTLPPSLLLLAVVGDEDERVREIDARRIYSSASRIPPENKNYVRLRSDDHGRPPLIGDHRAPTAPGELPGGGETRAGAPSMHIDTAREAAGSRQGPMVTDALDYYGTWKLFDGLADAVFRGTHREYALGRTPEQRFMGRWSDGVPVRELMVYEL